MRKYGALSILMAALSFGALSCKKMGDSQLNDSSGQSSSAAASRRPTEGLIGQLTAVCPENMSLATQDSLTALPDDLFDILDTYQRELGTRFWALGSSGEPIVVNARDFYQNAVATRQKDPRRLDFSYPRESNLPALCVEISAAKDHLSGTLMKTFVKAESSGSGTTAVTKAMLAEYCNGKNQYVIQKQQIIDPEYVKVFFGVLAMSPDMKPVFWALDRDRVIVIDAQAAFTEAQSTKNEAAAATKLRFDAAPADNLPVMCGAKGEPGEYDLVGPLMPSQIKVTSISSRGLNLTQDAIQKICQESLGRDSQLVTSEALREHAPELQIILDPVNNKNGFKFWTASGASQVIVDATNFMKEAKIRLDEAARTRRPGQAPAVDLRRIAPLIKIGAGYEDNIPLLCGMMLPNRGNVTLNGALIRVQ